jgi:hypothetical protein
MSLFLLAVAIALVFGFGLAEAAGDRSELVSDAGTWWRGLTR